MAVRGKPTHGGGRKKPIAQRPGELRSSPTPIQISPIRNSPGFDPTTIIKRLNCGSVGQAIYSWCATNKGPTPIAPNSVCTLFSDSGVRATQSTDSVYCRQYLFCPTGMASGSDAKVIQFGVTRLDLGELYAAGVAIPWNQAGIQRVSSDTSIIDVSDSGYMTFSKTCIVSFNMSWQAGNIDTVKHQALQRSGSPVGRTEVRTDFTTGSICGTVLMNAGNNFRIWSEDAGNVMVGYGLSVTAVLT